MRRVLLVLGIGLTAACDGAIGDAPESQLVPETTPDPSAEINVPAYTQAAVQVRLLPFSVRLAKVAAVVGKSTSDAMFAELLSRRYQLGDYDFANGLVADTQWSASRMSNWVDSLKPVCASADMAQRFPDLSGRDLDGFYKAATGRTLTQDEIAVFGDVLNGLTGEERDATTCLAVLSSLEFVAQ
ncbi:MAG: hypothetical protein ACAI38_21930 [Myxococcota bacterium]